MLPSTIRNSNYASLMTVQAGPVAAARCSTPGENFWEHIYLFCNRKDFLEYGVILEGLNTLSCIGVVQSDSTDVC